MGAKFLSIMKPCRFVFLTCQPVIFFLVFFSFIHLFIRVYIVWAISPPLLPCPLPLPHPTPPHSLQPCRYDLNWFLKGQSDMNSLLTMEFSVVMCNYTFSHLRYRDRQTLLSKTNNTKYEVYLMS
jgi:hypothetical protein